MKDPSSKIKKVLSFNHYGSGRNKYHNEDETLVDFVNWVNKFEGALLIIQNAPFDMGMINVRSSTKLRNEIIDTKDIIQLYYLPAILKLSETDDYYKNMVNKIGTSDRDNRLINSSMSKVAPALQIDMNNYHDALTDCRITLEMFCKIIEFLKENKTIDISKYQLERIKTKKNV